MNIIEKVVKLVDNSPLSRREVCRRANLNPNSFSNWKRGGNANLLNIEKVLNALGFELDVVLKAPETNQRNEPTPESDTDVARKKRTIQLALGAFDD